MLELPPLARGDLATLRKPYGLGFRVYVGFRVEGLGFREALNPRKPHKPSKLLSPVCRVNSLGTSGRRA